MRYPHANPNLWNIMPDYTDVDWNVIVSVVLSLIAILFTFDAISSDRERGTLRLILSNSVSRGTVLISKFLAALITISIPFLIAVFINLFLLYTSGSIPLGPSECGRLGIIVFIAFVYVSIFLGLGLLISSRVSNSSTRSHDSLTNLGCLGRPVTLYNRRAHQRLTADNDPERIRRPSATSVQ